MPSDDRGARAYFERIPNEWDALYSHENRLRYFSNRLLRKGLFDRHELTFKKCGNIAGAKVLDLGCGSGRYSIEFARRGAAMVIGVDFAPSMVDFARSMARELGLEDRCSFICADVQDLNLSEQFDITAALGLFDYVPDPGPLFKTIAHHTSGVFVGSFPKSSLVWGLQRRIRYNWIKNCPIYYYTESQLYEYLTEARFPGTQIIRMRSGFFVAARKA